ncbi:MAG: multicopper oxidase domain-containing protein [Gammaproteobacteria bacterium]|nr:multicopper oxidase domain-containing protein [Gammaproteobacteria bacterium]MCW8923561.1 multicopper oxidase domain-containing protein [Gammaproteobacteria bacterium]
MNINTFKIALLPLAIALALGSTAVSAGVLVQCPGDRDGSAVLGDANRETPDPDIKCMHLSAGDGYATMGDGTPRYIFSFADVTGMPTRTLAQKEAMIQAGMLAHEWPAPTIELEEGQEFYLNLTNVGMLMRPDLFDPHSVHFHGFPQSSTVFDGLPESGLSIGMNATLTYYYKLNDPGTYMYHCHVEATEHMQMGMLGNLYIKAGQNKLADGTDLNGFTHQTGNQYAYNDGDGSTYYDVEYPIQLGSFDSAFHDASESTQPLPFALMVDNYPMINGRGYPDTVDSRTDTFPPTPGSNAGPSNPIVPTSQPVSSLITANAGDRVLLRISNLAITRFYTLQSLGIPMHVVGKDAKLLRGPNGDDLYYDTNSVTVGGGESFDVILDTSGVTAGTYYLYTSNLNYLSNDTEAFGGMMTEIQIN